MKKETLLITGGSGSLGKALINHYQKNNPDYDLIVYSRDEGKHIQLPDNVTKVIGDIRDRDRLDYVFGKYKPSIVISAAALKRINDLELHPDEAIKTDILGTQNVMWACDKHEAEKCVHVSSDKAAAGVNVYSVCKFIGERLATNYNNFSKTKFFSVRYGNCINSRGAAVVVWLDRMKKGQELLVTDPLCSRYFFLLEEAVNFITSMIDIAEGGELFVPIMDSYTMKDVIKALEIYTGIEPKTRIIGMRPGEKYHEDMITEVEMNLSFKIDDMDVVMIKPQYYDVTPTKYSISPYTGKRLVSSQCLNPNIDDLVSLISRGFTLSQ